jgi:hypothetical protein
LLHRGRGRPSPRRLDEDLRQRISALIITAYPGLNDVHLTEKLQDHQPGLGARAAAQPTRRRRRPRLHRSRRPPEAAGGLVQVDGSPYEWLAARGPAMTLLGAIDDATSQLLAPHFRPTEGLHGYAVVFAQVFREYGLPLAIYGDRLNILVRNDRHWSLEEELHGAQHPTHLGRLLQELGIGYIQAHSPQAKGRVERLWQTLQDRLVSELRLRRIATLEAANAYLPTFLADYNRRFTCPPIRPPSGGGRRGISTASSAVATRAASPATTPSASGRAGCRSRGGSAGHSYAGCRVELREFLDGRLLVFPQDRCLATLPSPGPAFVLRPRSAPRWPAPPSRAPRRAHRDRSAPPGAPIRTGAGAAPDYPDHGDSEPTYRVLAEMKATGDVSPRPLLTTRGATSRGQRL